MNKYDILEVSTNTNIIIYGASVMGKCYAEILINNDYNVIAFLDKQAEKIDKIGSIPVYFPETNQISNYDKENGLVIITILNVYCHDDIAKKLSQLGYQNILFKHNIIGKKNPATRDLNAIYDRFYLLKDFRNIKLPKYSSLNDNVDYTPIIFEDDIFVTAFVPAESLFSLGKYYYEHDITYKDLPEPLQKNINKNILFFVKPKMLFEVMDNGIVDEEWSDYLKQYAAIRKYETKVSEIDREEWDRHFDDRFHIYQIMSNNLMIEPLYFQENPLSVVYSENNIFWIMDGINRAGFLLSKNIFKLPCRMKREEWEDYYNEFTIKKINSYIEQNEIKEIYYPIAHSGFIYQIAKEEILARRVVMSINEYLIKRKIETLLNKRILDIGSKNGYFAQLYSKMDANVTAVEDDEIWLELFYIINELLRINNISIKKNITSIEDVSEFDIIIIHHDSLKSSELYQLINNSFRGIIFLETIDECTEILDENYRCVRLMHMCIGSKTFNLYAIEKEA